MQNEFSLLYREQAEESKRRLDIAKETWRQCHDRDVDHTYALMSLVKEQLGEPAIRDMYDRVLLPLFVWRYEKFDIDKGIVDVQATISHLRKVPGCSGKVGTVGYCLGGQVAFLSATRTDSDASVGYYGVMIEKRLGEAGKIKKPLMLHIASKDAYCPPEAQKQIIDGLKGNSLATIHSYAEMDHAFAREGGQHYDKANADLANGRTDTFFRQHLG